MQIQPAKVIQQEDVPVGWALRGAWFGCSGVDLLAVSCNSKIGGSPSENETP